MSARRALVTGISGQDGSYLADLLLAKGYEVHGAVRRPVGTAFEHLAHIRDAVALHAGDLRDQGFISDLLRASRPHEIYNLAAMSSASESWSQPLVAAEVTGLAVARLLEEVRKSAPEARFFQASSSEIFGTPPEQPQSETTPLRPNNPYGAAKTYAHTMTASYRERHGLFCCNGILFNHESPRRRREFVTRKVTLAAAQISLGLQEELSLGNLDAQRDWGFAGDYVEGMWLMLQADEPADYVLATGQLHTVRDLVAVAFARVGLDAERHVRVDPRFVRPGETAPVLGDPAKALEQLGWQPRTPFEDLVRMMVDADAAMLSEAGR